MPDTLTIQTSDLLANDTGDDLRVTRVDQPLYGSLTYDGPNGTITYTGPAVGFTAGTPPTVVTEDAFSYTLGDRHGASDTARVTIRLVDRPVQQQYVGATLRQVRSFINVNGSVNTSRPPLVGSLLLAVLTRSTGTIFGDDPDAPRPRLPRSDWTFLAKSRDHDRLATTVAYQYVTDALHAQYRAAAGIRPFDDSPMLAPSSLVVWEFSDAAPTIEQAVANYSVRVLDADAYTSPPLDLPVQATSATFVSTLTARTDTALIGASGPDTTINHTEVQSGQGRTLATTIGSTPGGPILTLSGATNLSHVSLAVCKIV